jgi:ATP-dependent RNA helicase DeaD
METYRVEVGRKDGVRPGDLVGAIANEAGLDSEFIGHIKIHDDHCTVDLPKGMPPEVFRILQKTWVCQRQLQISLASGDRGKKPRRFERDRHGAPADFGEAPPAKQKKSFKKRSK